MRGMKKVEKGKAIIVNSEGLRRLADDLIEKNDKISLTVWCVDGTTLYPGSIEELLRFPNPKTREIQTISLSTPDGKDSSWEIWLSNGFSSPASYTVSGEDSYVIVTADRIENHLESMVGNGPHFLTSTILSEIVGPFLGGIGVTISFFGLLNCWPILAKYKHLDVGSWKFGDFASAATLICGLILILIGIRGKHFLSYFFPKVTFCIGDGEARHKRMTENRRLFGWGALITLVISILASWIANMLPTR
jgi:hypothetical protein